MARVYLALGSNVGNGDAHFDEAIKMMSEKLDDIRQAPRYSSKAYGVTDQPDFLNSAIEATTVLSPQDLLTFVKDIEMRVGRIWRYRWGPREIDIDIIFYGDEIVDEPNLHIPHIGFAERDFVLKPICDLNPSLVDPRSHISVLEIYKNLPNTAFNIKPQ